MELRTACTDPGGLPGDNFSDLFCSLQSSGRGQSTACDRPSNVGGFHRGQSDLAGNSMQRPECLSGAEHPDANSSARAKGPRLATVETKALPILVLPSLHHFNILFGHTSVLRWGTEHRDNMKCLQGLQQRGSNAHSAVRRVRERHIQHKGGTNMISVHYVGMDVDKEKIVLARLGAGRCAEVQEQVIANTPSAVKKHFTALLAGAEVHASYEAGCFGFGLISPAQCDGGGRARGSPRVDPPQAFRSYQD